MKLHLNKELYIDAVRFTAQKMNLKPEYIEKDYWVTYALQTVFENKIGKDTVFKGGTALSKCYHLIDRFSEDIDLVVLRREGETNSKMNKKIKAINKIVNAILPEVKIEGITHKKGMNRKTAHSYSKYFKGAYGQVKDVILVEATWLGHHEPQTTKSLSSLVGDMMLISGESEIAAKEGLMPFEVNVLEPVRTICEKIMSLIRFSYSENPIVDLRKKVRHVYDLHQLLKEKEFSSFLNSSGFDEMLIKVAKDDIKSFKNNNKWLSYHPGKAYLFKDLDSVWLEMIPAYRNEFRELVYGDLPDEAALLETLKVIRERLKTISWTIKIDIIK
jgi:hypothetical protein